jgi:hypothetical protein
MAWLASLSIFVKKYNIKGIESPARYCLTDRFAQVTAYCHTHAYQVALEVLKR